MFGSQDLDAFLGGADEVVEVRDASFGAGFKRVSGQVVDRFLQMDQLGVFEVIEFLDGVLSVFYRFEKGFDDERVGGRKFFRQKKKRRRSKQGR